MTDLYSDLSFPEPPADRPYTFINMVATIDGKTVSGSREEPVGDIGSEVDHGLMRRIEDAADAILLGAGALRSTPGLWYPAEKIRIVATESGNLDYKSRFFRDAPGKAIVLCPESAGVPHGVNRLMNDFVDAFSTLRTDWNVKHLLVEGGSALNGQLLELNLVDELFVTLAPKIKLGDCVPTYAGGNPLPREKMQLYRLLQHQVMGDEIFLRYRRIV